MILNAAAVDAKTLEAVRIHAENELYVPALASEVPALNGADLPAIGKNAAELKKPQDVCLIVLSGMNPKLTQHVAIMTKEQVAVINVTALQTSDPVQLTRRLQRVTLRGVASLFGIGPDMDPRSVMCDYETLAELDKMGLNFSPPWMDMVREAAAKRGLKVRPAFPPPPVAPATAK